MNAPAQQTPEWFAERAGCCTASRAADVLAKIKTGEAATRRKYRIQLCSERLTGIPVSGYQNAAMLWGTVTEPSARLCYESRHGELVEEVGFIKHPTMAWCGASPDGMIDADGLLEIKCPESTTHLEWMDRDCVPAEHIPQMQFQLWVTGRQWVDFVSYDPRFPTALQLFVKRTVRDDAYIAQLANEVGMFLKEVDQLLAKLHERVGA